MASRTKKPVKTAKAAKASVKKTAKKAVKTTASRNKPIPKKPVAKKPVMKKPVAKKAAVKKPVAKKPAAKKPVVKKVTRPVAKKASPKKAVAKTPARTAARKESLVTLRAHVNEIETRLIKADKATRSSVSALKASFTRLNNKSGAASNEQDSLLSEQLESLSTHLTGLIDKTRADVAHDLQMVLDDPRMETVSTALTKANHRITTAEREQARAIGAINEQISTLAAIVDDRLQAETREREKLGHALSEKIDTVETRSATAVRSIGDKVVTLTEELNTRAQDRHASLKQDVTDQGEQQQLALEAHKSEISRRIEALEDDQRNTIPSIERRLVTLESRLESLENDRFAAEEYAKYAQPAYAPMPEAEVPAPPPVSEPMNVDAFSPQQAVAYETVMPPEELVNQPQLQPTGESSVYEAPPTAENATVPDEYVPQEYVPPVAAEQGYTPQPFNPQQFRAPDATEQAPAQAPQMAAPEAQGVDPYAPQAVDPYAAYETPAPAPMDPGYAVPPSPEQAYAAPVPGSDVPPPPFMNEPPSVFPHPEQTMDAARPGGPAAEGGAPKKRGLFSLIKGGKGGASVGSSPVKLFALMTGLAVVGLFGAQKLLLSGDDANTAKPQTAQSQPADPVQMTASAEGQPAFDASQSETPVIESMDVVGDYSETMQAPDLEPEAGGIPSQQRLTLETAAGEGDKIAQFQMGLSHLEAGRNAEAVRLIRLSANQGQAAAQYRLAKLYETGIGVEKNPQTAMKLLERSAKGGNRIAMHDLGHYYATAAATPEPDIGKAVEWFHKAAERGVLDSQFNLGVLYQEGSGVNKSDIDAYVWYAIAGAQGDKMAAQRSEIIARQLSEADLDKAMSRAKAFTPARIDEAANGIFRDLPWSPASKSVGSSGNPDVKTAQERLADLGYEIGTPDGAMGPKTRNAIIRFERANGLPETGRVSVELIERLNLAAGV